MAKEITKYSMLKSVILQQIQEGTLKPGDKLPTEIECAELYGVSTVTVKHAFADLVDEGYIIRVRHSGSFVKERDANTSTAKLLALVLFTNDKYDTSYIRIMQGVQTTVSRQGFSLLVDWIDGTPRQESASIEALQKKGVSGFIIYPKDPDANHDNYQKLTEQNIPFVLLDRYELGFKGNFSGCNNCDGGELAVEHLISMGHSRIAYAGNDILNMPERERYAGCCIALQRHHLVFRPENLLLSINYDHLFQRIKLGEITAVFCCNDRLAVKMIRELESRGLDIPGDVSIVGFDDWMGDSLVQQRLTTVHQDFTECGSNAAVLLTQQILNQDFPTMKLLSDVHLIKRKSVRRLG